MHTGVIGGGVAGLTAAYRLAQAGEQVTLWERS
ncbi:MAG: FAD-dependent oxidoreductase, partial [Thermomicrobiales bacterium]|nr:FAD-dependent oxidoreductase [Thermomicrobiales bacterium]